MPTVSENVRSSGKTGSDPCSARTTRLTQSGLRSHAAGDQLRRRHTHTYSNSVTYDEGSGPPPQRSRSPCRYPCSSRQHTAPTTFPFTRIGIPPRSAAMPAVTNAVRPRLMFSSISSLGRCSRAAVRAFSMARSALAGRTPSIRWKASRSPAGSTTAIAEGALRCCARSFAACRTVWAPS
jgi:hypothetical protein